MSNKSAESLTASGWSDRGRQLLRTGELAGAVSCFRHAIQLEPAVAMHWARLAKLQAALRDYDEAAAGFERACALASQVPDFHILHGSALREQNNPRLAIEAFQRALTLDPDNLHAALGVELMLPPVYEDAGALRSWRMRYAAGLERLHAGTQRWIRRPRQVLSLEWQNFYLAYQGGADRTLQVRYNGLLSTLLAAVVPELQVPLPVVKRNAGRLKVGFVSADFRECTVGDYFLGWVTGLPREAFETWVLYTGFVDDVRTDEFRGGANHFEKLGGGAKDIAAAIRARDLDIIVYPDVGMTAMSTLLSNLRLAPLQFAAWGHPVTTGSRFIDFYVSCALMEPDDGATQYSEKLILLPGIGVKYRPARRSGRASRSRFGLDDAKHVYLAPHSLHKIHPETDPLLIEILAQDSDALLVFFAGPTRQQTEQFIDRIVRAMRDRGLSPRSQLKVLPRLARPDFLDVMSVADVMLDPLHWSGGNTALDALTALLPVVALPGATMRSRQSAAMLTILGLDELIARGPADYVAIALRIAANPAYRATLVDRVRRNAGRLYGRDEPVAALAAELRMRHENDVRAA